MQVVVDRTTDKSLSIPARYWIAEAIYRQGDYTAAGDAFTQLDTETQGAVDSWLGILPLRRAQVLAHQKKWTEALKLTGDIRERFSDFGQMYEVDYLAGRCMAAKANFRDARRYYEAVVASKVGGTTETAAMAQWMIGESYFMQNQFEDALRSYYRVIARYAYPQWQAAAKLQAGKCYESMRRWDDAQKLYSQVTAEHKETSFAEEAEQRLQVIKSTTRTATLIQK